MQHTYGRHITQEIAYEKLWRFSDWSEWTLAQAAEIFHVGQIGHRPTDRAQRVRPGPAAVQSAHEHELNHETLTQHEKCVQARSPPQNCRSETGFAAFKQEKFVALQPSLRMLIYTSQKPVIDTYIIITTRRSRPWRTVPQAARITATGTDFSAPPSSRFNGCNAPPGQKKLVDKYDEKTLRKLQIARAHGRCLDQSTGQRQHKKKFISINLQHRYQNRDQNEQHTSQSESSSNFVETRQVAKVH